MNHLNALEESARLLLDGELILLPTDTDWSLGASLNEKDAVAKITKLAADDGTKGPVILVDSLDSLSYYVQPIHPRIENLLFFHQRPLTVVFPNVHHLPPGVQREDGAAAFSIVLNSFCVDLIKKTEGPLVVIPASPDEDAVPFTTDRIHDSYRKVAAFEVPKEVFDREREPAVWVSYNKKGDLLFLDEQVEE